MANAVTLKVMVDPGPRLRPMDAADEETLSSAHELIQFGASELSLLSGDTAMALRADAKGIQVIALPKEYLRTPSQAEPGVSDDCRRAKRKIRRARCRQLLR